MGVQNPNTTGYVHPNEPNLLNLHKALEYNSNGQPMLRVSIGDENVEISGNVFIPGNIEVFSTPDNPVHSHITEVGTSGILTVPWMPVAGNVTIDSGNINVNNFPSNVSITQMPGVTIVGNVEITNDIGNPIPISRNTQPNSSSNPINVNLMGSGSATGISSSIDSKGRLKVQTQEAIFFNTFQYGKETDIWDETTTNGASATFLSTISHVDMSVTSAVGSKVIRQTRQVQRYAPGRMPTVIFSVRLTPPTEGVRRRFGMFNGQDGFFFEDCGTLDPITNLPQYACVVINSNGPTVERIYRDDWNGDKLDGLGESGITANPSAQQMIQVDYEWYGGGQVVFSFVMDGLPRVIHTFNNGNRLTQPWCKTPFLPIRLEIENFGGAAGTHHLYQGSNAILIEGGALKAGVASNILTPLTGIALDEALVFYPVISIRLKPTCLEAVVMPSHFVANTLDNTDIYYKVVRNATLNGTWVDNPDTNAFTQYNITSTGAITDGFSLDSGFITAGGMGRIDFNLRTDLQLGRSGLGTISDTITIAIASKIANKKAVASLTWIEQR